MIVVSSLLHLLRLLHLADSALPIGGVSHSFGLESLIEDGQLTGEGLFGYCADTLSENLLLDAVYCRQAHRHPENVRKLNDELSAFRLARESREASLTLGARLLELALKLEPLQLPIVQGERVHLCIVFGCVASALGFGADETVAAYLHQAMLNVLSAAQRLVALGHFESCMLAWDLKREIETAAHASATIHLQDAGAFSYLPELSSMRHPFLSTRLFIS